MDDDQDFTTSAVPNDFAESNDDDEFDMDGLEDFAFEDDDLHLSDENEEVNKDTP